MTAVSAPELKKGGLAFTFPRILRTQYLFELTSKFDHVVLTTLKNTPHSQFPIFESQDFAGTCCKVFLGRFNSHPPPPLIS